MGWIMAMPVFSAGETDYSHACADRGQHRLLGSDTVSHRGKKNQPRQYMKDLTRFKSPILRSGMTKLSRFSLGVFS